MERVYITQRSFCNKTSLAGKAFGSGEGESYCDRWIIDAASKNITAKPENRSCTPDATNVVFLVLCVPGVLGISMSYICPTKKHDCPTFVGQIAQDPTNTSRACRTFVGQSFKIYSPNGSIEVDVDCFKDGLTVIDLSIVRPLSNRCFDTACACFTSAFETDGAKEDASYLLTKVEPSLYVMRASL